MSCRTRITSQAMTSKARRGTAPRPRVLPSVRHWVTAGQAGGRGVGGQAVVSPSGQIWVRWDLLTLGECWLRGGHLEAVQEVFSLEER